MSVCVCVCVCIQWNITSHKKEYNFASRDSMIDLEDITLSEMSDEDKYCITSYMWNLKNTAN